MAVATATELGQTKPTNTIQTMDARRRSRASAEPTLRERSR